MSEGAHKIYTYFITTEGLRLISFIPRFQCFMWLNFYLRLGKEFESLTIF